jgi:hypothetical protein
MRLRKSMLLSLSILLGLLTACQADNPSQKEVASQLSRGSYGEALQMADRQEELYQFITAKLSGQYGVYTNLQETDQSSEVATGHEVLSESAGLLMRYFVHSGQKERFDEQWQLTKQTFDMKSGFSYRYSPKLTKKYTLNASIDDLRVIRALEEAAIVFHTESYADQAKTYGNRFFKNQVVDAKLTDFYDETYQMNNSFITLCYIDTTTLQLTSIPKKKKAALVANMLQIAKSGYLSDDFPFYQTRYDYAAKSYQSEEIHTVESLLTILHLAEAKQHQDLSIRYLKEQIKNDTLYANYAMDGKPLNDVRSTAIYAIAAMIGSVLQDKELYEASIQRMNAFQNQDPLSPLYGGFGDKRTMQAYSFDNLMALLAYVYK